MSDEEYFRKTIKSSETFIARWKGSAGIMWELTYPGRDLKLLLTRGEEEKNLRIACMSPEKICGPVRWEDANPVVSLITLADGTAGFRVADARVGLEVLCKKVHFAENVKRI